MKKKIVIKMFMHDEKCRSKALKIAVCVPGVESAAVTGEEKNLVEVVGDGVDSVELTRRLRKKMGHAELLSLEEAAAATADEKKPEENTVAPPYWGYPQYYQYEVREPTWGSPCTIMCYTIRGGARI